MESTGETPPPNGVRLDWNTNLGHILQAAVVVIGLVSWAIASAGRAEQARRELGRAQDRCGVPLRDLPKRSARTSTEIREGLPVFRRRAPHGSGGKGARGARRAERRRTRISAVERQLMDCARS